LELPKLSSDDFAPVIQFLEYHLALKYSGRVGGNAVREKEGERGALVSTCGPSAHARRNSHRSAMAVKAEDRSPPGRARTACRGQAAKGRGQANTMPKSLKKSGNLM